MYLFIKVEIWDYRLEKEKDGRFFLWHHVTPADGGYGVETQLYLPADYFKTHTVKEFYEMVCDGHCRPRPDLFNKAEQIKTIKQQLKDAGWL